MQFTLIKKPVLLLLSICILIQDQSFAFEFEKHNNLNESGLQQTTIFKYWNFNTSAFLEPTLVSTNASIDISLAVESEYLTGSGQGFSGINAQFGDLAGNHLRINNPIGSSITLNISTVGFKNILLAYETRRSGQGPGIQNISYSLDGQEFIYNNSFVINDAAPDLILIDFSDINGADNNQNFKVLIEFEQGTGGVAGNQRFDNITVSGSLLSTYNQAPVLTETIRFQQYITGQEPVAFNLNDFFSDPEGSELTYVASNSNLSVISLSIVDNTLIVSPLKTGDAQVEIIANDGELNSPKMVFRTLVYPNPKALSEENFAFAEWSPNEPEGAFPNNMIFLQSGQNDPALLDGLDFAYHIPESDYSSDDQANIGFPYKNSSRTRINGLDEDGIAFINTGRGRDLGGALIAIDTRNIPAAKLKFVAQTLIYNSRIYNIAVFYRRGVNTQWIPFLNDEQNIFGYLSQAGPPGDNEEVLEISLPQSIIGEEYVQILIKYYFTGTGAGPRTQIRVDDISISKTISDDEEGEVPAAVNLIYPENTSEDIDLNTEFTWFALESSYTYLLQISEDFHFNSFLVNELLNANVYKPEVELKVDSEYFWRVKAINSNGGSEWSSTYRFLTSAKTPTEKLIEKLKLNEISILEINTKNQAPVVTKDDYIKGNILVHEYKNGVFEVKELEGLEIKGRGNTTWTLPKKPYRLKLSTAETLLGMPENRHWVLLANYSDKTLSRVNTAFNLSKYLELPYTPRDRAVELVLNGEYMGSYLLTERIKIGPDRVNITEINSDENGVYGGVILEIDSRRSEEHNFQSPKGVIFVVNDPDDLNSKDPSEIDERFNYVQKIILDAEENLYSDSFKDEQTGYKNHLNVSTFINWYLVNEIFRNNDATFLYSVYMYIDDDKKINMGPVWDFDISAGNVSNANRNPVGFHVKKSPWIARLFEDPNFENAVTERWAEIRDDLPSFLDNSILNYSQDIYKSQKSNFERWPIIGKYVWPNYFIGQSYEEEIFYFRQWLSQRIFWLDTQFSSSDIIEIVPISQDLIFEFLYNNKSMGTLLGYHPTAQLTYTINSYPSNGSIKLDETTGEFVYTPNQDFYGVDQFTYFVSHGNNFSDTATVTININITLIEPFSAIYLDNSIINANEPIGSLIGKFSTFDEKEDDPHIYTFAIGEGDYDNSSFEIIGNELFSATLFNYSEKKEYWIRVRSTDKSGLFFEEKFLVEIEEPIENEGPLSVNQELTNVNIISNVFPNPTTDVVNIKLNPDNLVGLKSIEVLNIMGKSYIFSNQITVNEDLFHLDIKDLPSGLYIIKLTHSKGVQLYKLLIN